MTQRVERRKLSGAQEFKRIVPDNVLPTKFELCSAQQIWRLRQEQHIVTALNGAARSEKLRNKVLKTFEFNNRMKLEVVVLKETTKFNSSNFLEFFNLLAA